MIPVVFKLTCPIDAEIHLPLYCIITPFTGTSNPVPPSRPPAIRTFLGYRLCLSNCALYV